MKFGVRFLYDLLRSTIVINSDGGTCSSQLLFSVIDYFECVWKVAYDGKTSININDDQVVLFVEANNTRVETPSNMDRFDWCDSTYFVQ